MLNLLQRAAAPQGAADGLNLLALDTSTEWMSLAVQRAGVAQPWTHHAPGAALTSTQLIPQIQALMARAELRFEALDAIVLGIGPGSFTGLRSACAVAQGLAFASGVPVLPVDTLLAVAEDARWQGAAKEVFQVTALLDARMDELYAASYLFQSGQWTTIQACSLIRPEELARFCGLDRTPDASQAAPTNPASRRWAAGARTTATTVLAGNVFTVYAARLPDMQALRVSALPTATALLRLAPALLAAGAAVPAAQALPTYVRDKVAQTTQERVAARNAGALA